MDTGSEQRWIAFDAQVREAERQGLASLQRTGQVGASLDAFVGLVAQGVRARTWSVIAPPWDAQVEDVEAARFAVMCAEDLRQGRVGWIGLAESVGGGTLIAIPFREGAAVGRVGVIVSDETHLDVPAWVIASVESSARSIGVTQAEQLLVQRWESVREAEHEIERRLASAEQVRSGLLAAFVREFRPGLSALLGYADLLAGAGESREECEEWARCVQQSAHATLGMLQDIADLGELEAGRLAPEPRAFGVRKLLEDVLAGVRPRAAEKMVELAGEIHDDVPEEIELDRTMLRRVLKGLLRHAVQVTGSGRVEMTVDRGGDERIIVNIRDGGPARSSPTGRLQESEPECFGLHVAERLIGVLGGAIAVQREGERNVTIVELPTSLGASSSVGAPADLGSNRPVSVPTSARASIKGCSVLLVESELDGQDRLEQTLEQAGLVVESVQTGEQAVVLAEQSGRSGSAFDIIVVDMEIPMRDGLDAVRAMRGRGMTCPIIGIVAGGAGERESCLRNGCTVSMSKPVSPTELFARMRGLIGRSASRAA